MGPTANEQMSLALSGGTNPDTIAINGRCVLRREGRIWMVSVAGLPMHQWVEGDTAAEAYAKVSLVRCGYAGQNEVARVFGCSTRTLRRQERRYERLGMEGLGRRRGRPVGTPGPSSGSPPMGPCWVSFIAIAALCEMLNRMEVCFPGTSLRMRYGIEGPV